MRLQNMLAVIVGAMAFALTPAGAQAQAQPQAQQQVVSQFDDSTISRLLLSVQANFNIESGANGQKVFRVAADGGIAFTVSPRSCSPETGCLSLLMVAVFTGNDTSDVGKLDELLHRYNDLNPAGKVYRAGDGVVVLQDYLNAAYGISYGNAQTQLLVFGSEINKIRNELNAFSQSR